MRLRPALVAAALLCASAPASADDAARGVAESLFAEGKALMAKGKTAAACAKFEASRDVDPKAVGVLLNLGLCNEKLGKLASAWRQLREVASRSRADRPDRAKLADDKAAAIEPRLSRVAVRIASAARVPGLALTLDDAPLPEAAWDTELPVDGGAHVLRATAPERLPRTLQVTVRGERDRTSFDLDALDPAPPPPPPPPVVAAPPPPPPVEPSGGRRAAGLGLVIGGGVVALAGGAFGVATLVESGRVADACPSPCVRGSARAADADAVYSRANAFGWVANVAIPVGVVGAGLGAYLLATQSSSAPPTASRIRLTPGPAVAGHGASVGLSYGF